jgi:serine/threonine protein kinase
MLGVDVALKRLKRRAADVETQSRFRQESRMLRRLVHPGIVRTYDCGLYRGTPWFTMELLEGASLRELLEARRGEPFSPRSALRLGAAVAGALVAVHDHDIVHRDLKPSNVFVVRGGGVKLFDFGIAASLQSPLKLTTPEIVMGSPAYLSPERLRTAAPAKPTADLYALGVLLFECLTGARPFSGGPVDRLLERICDEPAPRVRSLAPTVPVALDELVNDLLAKRPEHRPISAAQLKRQLRAIAADLRRD